MGISIKSNGKSLKERTKINSDEIGGHTIKLFKSNAESVERTFSI
jgi:hypothetical protein